MRRSAVVSVALVLLACGFLGGCKQDTRAVFVKTLKDNRYALIVNGSPYLIKGVCYNPVPVGEGYDYEWWSDPAKPWIADGKLMKEMGVNTVRIYQAGAHPEQVKAVIQDLYSLYGIRVVLGHWLGFWEYPCPLYGDAQFKERVKQEVLAMVKLYKDEPGILMWVLGNENNYSCLGQVNPWSTPEIDREPDPYKQKQMRARLYYTFVNEIAKEVHALDQNHPVALGNGELIGLDTAASVCTDIDVVACIIYRGKTFGNLFRSLRATFDKPLFISEFGADSYDAFKDKEDQNMQAFFLESQWRQIYQNIASAPEGEGNCLGGTMFEWTDEWWKHTPFDQASWKTHDPGSNWSNGSYYFDIQAPQNMNMNEEWFGIVALSEEKQDGLNKRVPRKAYYVVREFWKKPQLETKARAGAKK